MGVGILRGLAVGILLTAAGCAAKHPAGPSPPDLSSRLADADASLAAGCFDCLRNALDKYQAVRTVAGALPAAVERATTGAFRAAALLALRQRELGMVDDGYLKTAKDLAAESCSAAAAGCGA